MPNFMETQEISIDSMLEYRLKIFKIIKVEKSKFYFTNRFDFFMYSCTALKINCHVVLNLQFLVSKQ